MLVISGVLEVLQNFFRTFLWSNSSVKVTIVGENGEPLNDYTINYSDNSGALRKYNGTGETVNAYGTTVRAQITDGTNTSSTVTATVDWIDKNPPEITAVTADKDSITFSATDDLSGIASYAITESDSKPADGEFTHSVTGYPKQLDNEKATGLKSGTTYCVWVRDRAGTVSFGREINTAAGRPVLMRSDSGKVSNKFLRTDVKRGNIASVGIVESFGAHDADEPSCWDVSEKFDGSVLCWVDSEDSGGRKNLLIGGTGGKIVLPDGSNYFACIDALTHEAGPCVWGLNWLDTSEMTWATYMFQKCGTNCDVPIDFGGDFDTSSVCYMSHMFEKVGQNFMTSFDFPSGFNTSSATSMNYMFYFFR